MRIEIRIGIGNDLLNYSIKKFNDKQLIKT